jgi:GTP:adenosylcobinamide-phosphate guanylyltransferase
MRTIGNRARFRPPKALILAAGEGTRLRPLTLDRPKPMLPIAGRPLLEHTIRWLHSYGVHEIAINLHYRPAAIVQHFGDGAAFDVCIVYSYEDPILGTAGAVRKLARFFDSGPFLVVYGDVLTDLDLGRLMAFHAECGRRDPSVAATLSLYHVPNPTEVGLVGLDLTMVTISGLPILIGLGVDFAIQFHNREEEEFAKTGHADTALKRALTTVGTALLVALLAATIGFLVLHISRVPMIRDFGSMLAVGTFILFISCLFFLLSLIYWRYHHLQK